MNRLMGQDLENSDFPGAEFTGNKVQGVLKISRIIPKFSYDVS